MISIVTDGFWANRSAIILPPTSVGGAPWPAPSSPSLAIREASVQGALIRPSGHAQGEAAITPPQASITPSAYVRAFEALPQGQVSQVVDPDCFCEGIAIEGLGGWTFGWSSHEQSAGYVLQGMSQYGAAAAQVQLYGGTVGAPTEPSNGLLENGIGTARINKAAPLSLCGAVQLAPGTGPSNLAVPGTDAVHYRAIYKSLAVVPAPSDPLTYAAEWLFQLRSTEGNLSAGMVQELSLPGPPDPEFRIIVETTTGEQSSAITLASLPTPWFGKYHLVDIVRPEIGTSTTVSVFIDGRDYSWTLASGDFSPYTTFSPALGLFSDTDIVFRNSGLFIFAGLAIGREIDFARHMNDARSMGVI